MKNKNGYTLAEIILAVWIGFLVLSTGAIIYASIHFALKFW